MTTAGDERRAVPKAQLCMVRNALVVQGAITARFYDTFATLPGKRRRIDGILYIEATDNNLQHLLTRHQDLEKDSKVEALIENLAAENKRRQDEAERQRRDSELETENFPFKSTPYEHQLLAFQRFCRSEYFALFFEMGAGKTKTFLDIAAYKYSTGEIDTVVMVAPNGVHKQWILEQLPEHLPDFTNYRGYFFHAGSRRKGRDDFEEVLNYKDGLRIFSFNIESLTSDNGKKAMQTVFHNSGKVLMGVDESTKIKNHKAKRTQFILQMGDRAVCRGIMNGSPVTQGIQDLFSQFLFLSDKILGVSNYYVFQNRYLVMGGFEGRQVVGYRNLEELQTKIDDYSMRVLKEDCLDLPEKIFIDREVEMSDEQERLYQQLKKDFLTVLTDGTVITVAEAMVRMMKLQQILCGHIRTEEGVTKRIDDSRAHAVLDVLEDTIGKTIVWCRFTEDTNLLIDMLTKNKIGWVRYTGQENSDQKTEAVKKFREDPNCRVFIANPMAAGTGLNLTVATTVIWYSPSYSLNDYLQANDRCHRIGQHFPVTYIHLKAPGTVDGKILSALRRKQELARTVMDIRELFD